MKPNGVAAISCWRLRHKKTRRYTHDATKRQPVVANAAYIWSRFPGISETMSFIRCILVGLFLAAAAHSAVADICVTCSGPAALYNCSVKNADTIESLAGAKAIQKICTKVLKRNGQHASCTASEAPSCPGAATTIGWKEVKEALASADEPEAPPAAKPQPPKDPAKAKTAIPPPAQQPNPPAKTVVNEPATAVAPEAAPEHKDETIVGNLKGAAEKTWGCVSSFFGKC